MKKGSEKIVACLTMGSNPFDNIKQEKEDSKPYWIFLMEDGGCVTGGEFGPFMFYYPTWEFMAFFTGVKVEDYDMNIEAPLPAWDVESTPFGPMGRLGDPNIQC